MSKAECAAALAKPAYVEALQDALAAELARVIRSQFDPKYSPATPFRPSVWCGSLVMEAVVGDTLASQLREHYSSGGNELQLEVAGQSLVFVPQPTTTTPSKIKATAKDSAADSGTTDPLSISLPAIVAIVLILSLVVVIAMILVIIFITKGRNNSKNDGDTDVAVYEIDETVGDEIDVHIIQTPKKKEQSDPENDDPYASSIEMQEFSPTSN